MHLLSLRTSLAALLLVGSAACTGLIGDDGEGGTGGPDDDAKAVSGLGSTPLRRLTRLQYDNTIHQLLGIDASYADAFSPDEKIGAFHSNAVAPVTELDVENYMSAAEAIAAQAVAESLDSLVPCDAANVSGAEAEACATAFIESFGPRAYRRALTDLEVEELLGVYGTGLETDFASGIRLIIQTALQSPNFIYHVEPLGEAGEKIALDGYAIASRLSYFLWASMPDDVLFEAAAAGELDTVEGIRTQTARMLADDKARVTLANFHRQWLGLDAFDYVIKDPTLFPQFDDGMKAAMLKETDDFVDYVIRKGDGKLATLMTADFSFPGEELTALYDIEQGSSGGEPVSLDPSQRSGLLTHASVLAMHSHADQTSPIHRGVMVRQNVLCQTLPTPPENVNNTPPDPDPNLTTRERFAQHVEDPACAGCHSLIDGIGFGFENYDALGRFQAEENGLAVDASGEIVSAEGIEGAFDGVVELSEILSDSQLVQECFATQWFRYAFGRVEDDADRAQLDVIHEAFAASEHDVKELIFTIATSDAFRYRITPTQQDATQQDDSAEEVSP